MKTILKMIIALLAMACFTSSCEKQENGNAESNIKANAVEFSQQHDRYVKEMLEYQATVFPQKSDITIDDILDMIEGVFGERPEIVIDLDQISNDSKIIDFDSERMKLVDYATSERIESYLSSMDEIIENMEGNEDLATIYQLLDEIENQALADDNTNAEDKETVATTVEVLKGSLALWSDYIYENGDAKGNLWPRWKKVLFIAAADAIGAAAGFFSGGSFLLLFGVTLPIPPGIAGAGAAAVVSGIAYVWVNLYH
jgi:hypothetical protein